MSVRDEHRSASSCVRNDRSRGAGKGLKVLLSQLSCAIQITCVSMQRSATNLGFWTFHCKAICFKHAFCCLVHPCKQSFTDAAFEQHYGRRSLFGFTGGPSFVC